MPPSLAEQGHIVFVLSVTMSVCLSAKLLTLAKTFELSYNKARTVNTGSGSAPVSGTVPAQLVRHGRSREEVRATFIASAPVGHPWEHSSRHAAQPLVKDNYFKLGVWTAWVKCFPYMTLTLTS